MSKRKNSLLKQCKQHKDANDKHICIAHDHSNTGDVLLIKGGEEDLYPNEQTEIIVEILKEYLEKYAGKTADEQISSEVLLRQILLTEFPKNSEVQ